MLCSKRSDKVLRRNDEEASAKREKCTASGDGSLFDMRAMRCASEERMRHKSTAHIEEATKL